MTDYIEEYEKTGVAKVFIKSKVPKPINYFYADLEFLYLVKQHNWALHYSRGIYYPYAWDSGNFHNILANEILGKGNYDYIDHINHVEIDDIDANLNVVSVVSNQRNRFVIGYSLSGQNVDYFQSGIHLPNRDYISKCFKSELEAIEYRYFLEQNYFKDYSYDFLLDRSHSLDILDLERTGKIDSDEAIYRHILKHVSQNPLFVYRFNLHQYCKDNHIPVPDFDEDEQGFMIDKITRKKLCPLWKE